jgi:phosphate-selective porin
LQTGGSFVNVDDGGIGGGLLSMTIGGLNWYPDSHVKSQFNYGFGRVAARESDGNLNLFQTRVEVDL